MSDMDGNPNCWFYHDVAQMLCYVFTGHGDYCFDGQRAGCVELLTTIQQRVKPQYHIFGHIHEGIAAFWQ